MIQCTSCKGEATGKGALILCEECADKWANAMDTTERDRLASDLALAQNGARHDAKRHADDRAEIEHMKRMVDERDSECARLRADLAARDAEIVVWETFYECARNLDPSLEHLLARIRLGELSDSTDPRCYQCRWQGDIACAGHPKAGDCDAFEAKALEGQGANAGVSYRPCGQRLTNQDADTCRVNTASSGREFCGLMQECQKADREATND